MDNATKESFYRYIDELLRRPSDEVSTDDILYLIRGIIEEL